MRSSVSLMFFKILGGKQERLQAKEQHFHKTCVIWIHPSLVQVMLLNLPIIGVLNINRLML